MAFSNQSNTCTVWDTCITINQSIGLFFMLYSSEQLLDRMAMNRFYDDKLGGLKKPSHRRWDSFFFLGAYYLFTLIICWTPIFTLSWSMKSNWHHSKLTTVSSVHCRTIFYELMYLLKMMNFTQFKKIKKI